MAIPRDTSLADLLKPTYWENVAPRLLANDQIRVVADESELPAAPGLPGAIIPPESVIVLEGDTDPASGHRGPLSRQHVEPRDDPWLTGGD